MRARGWWGFSICGRFRVRLGLIISFSLSLYIYVCVSHIFKRIERIFYFRQKRTFGSHKRERERENM